MKSTMKMTFWQASLLRRPGENSQTQGFKQTIESSILTDLISSSGKQLRKNDNALRYCKKHQQGSSASDRPCWPVAAVSWELQSMDISNIMIGPDSNRYNNTLLEPRRKQRLDPGSELPCPVPHHGKGGPGSTRRSSPPPPTAPP
jgi:hypothetical protein